VAVIVHVYSITGERLGDYRVHQSLKIGRNPDCDIVLESPYASPVHAELRQEGDELFADSLGHNGLLIGEFDVPRGKTRRLSPEDVISIPGYVIHFTGVRGDQRSSDVELERGFSDLKRQIHQELLEESGLRNQAAEVGDSRIVEQLRQKLDELLDRYLDLEDDMIDFIVKKEIREQVVDVVVRGERDQARRSKLSWRKTSDESAFDNFVDACAAELGVDDKVERTSIAKVMSGFDEVFSRNRDVLNPVQRRFIVRESVRADIDALMFGLGPLEDLLNLDDITEIMVVGRDRIFIEKGGGLEETGRTFPTEEDLNVAVNRMVKPIGRAVNRAEPIVDARLEDGSRVHIVIPPVAIHGTSVTIRRFREEPFTIEDLINFGTFTERAVSFLRGCILARKNIVISGGTGSGKTTLLNVLGAQIPFDQRLVVIEDSAELQLPQPNLVNLEARKANLEGKGEIPIKALVRAALRMRPDRIVVGECRGGEALDMLQAMNTGHDGSMTTGHSNSPREMLQRLQVMVMEAGESMPVTAIRQQIAAAVDVIIQIQRQRDRVRRVTHISEVVGYDQEEEAVVMEDIFTMAEAPGEKPELRFTGYLPTFIDQMLRHGEVELEDLF
jgi:pilus assembly protein CpaF